MLGRTYKDLATQAASAKEREQFLRRAAETYAQAYQLTGGYWSGINAATTSLLIDEVDRARSLAHRIHDQCLKLLTDETVDQYWPLAALGEAALILREWSQAEDWYARAAQQGAGRFGDLQSSRRNAHLILQYWNAATAKIDSYLRAPPVIVFAGHMIDQPDRATPRFPSHLESVVAEGIRARIQKLRPGFGFASAACGSDIVFLEAMLDAGAEVSIVLPYNREEFVRDSVDFLPNSNWRVRFEGVLERATQCVIASTQRLEIGGVSYDYCNQILLGLATIHSARLNTELVPLGVWDGTDGDGPGGTASAVRRWQKLGYQPEVVDLAKMADEFSRRGRRLPVDRSGPVKSGEANRFPYSSDFRSRIVAILFADAVGFSKLTETEVPRFVEHFLGAIAKLDAQFSESIIAKNTWGDGLYFVFSDVDLAGRFALQLADLIAATNWEEKGLRPSLNLRIALHAGPVYEFDDPITGSRSYGGTHVSRAARMEPITPSGQVYASEAFAALAAAQGVNNFACDYIGQTPLAKGYGTLPTYHVRSVVVSANL